MSIELFTHAAQLLYTNNFYYEALCLVCCAIDACAAVDYPKLRTSERYKKFLADHFRIICRYGFPGIEASQIKIKLNCKVEDLKPDQDGYVDMTQIIYHTIRCGLVHKSAIDNSIIFVDRTIIGNYEDGHFYVPRSLILGLISAIDEGRAAQ